MAYYVYILVSEADGFLYTGQTNDLVERVHKHNKGLVRTTRARIPYTLGYFEVYESRSKAMSREWELKKKWNTERKKKLVKAFDRRKIREVLGL